MVCLVNPEEIDGFLIGFNLKSGMYWISGSNWPGHRAVEQAENGGNQTEEFWDAFWERYLKKYAAAEDKAFYKYRLRWHRPEWCEYSLVHQWVIAMMARLKNARLVITRAIKS